MLDPPGRAIADTNQALQLQGRDVVLGLSQKVKSLKPRDQGQLSGMKDRFRSQRGLPMAPIALEGFYLAMPHNTVATALAFGANEAGWPAGLL